MGKKKLSPEELQAQFQEWKASSVEFALLTSLKNLKADLPQIYEITPDITEKWQPFLDEFIKVGPVFKIKGATIKSLLQEQLRTAFFGGVNKRDEPFTIDQFSLDFVNKDTPKNCRHVKNSFVDFLKVVDDVDNQSEETYLDWKKNKVIYKYKEFCKFYKEHVKKDKGHMEAKVLLEKVLFPFKRLMESSTKLTLFELGTKSDQTVAENYFQFIADVKSFALNFQEILGILFTFARDKVRVNPNVYATFKKLYYPNWEANPVEAHFITPLLEALDMLRVNLFKLYSMGPNFWKQPLSDNTVFVDNVADYLEKETIAEEMLGNILSRAQTNYLYQICLVIHQSQLRDNLVAREKKVIEKTLPQLVVLRSLSHVNKVVNKKIAALLKKPEQEESNPSEEQGGPTSYSKVFGRVGKTLRFELMNAQQPSKDFTPQSLIPEGYVHQEMIRTPTGVDLELVINENNQEDLDSFGRLLMWSDFLPKEDHAAFIAKARSIRDLNQALINDLEDFIIVDGMMSSAENYLNDRAAAIEKMNVLNNHILHEKKTGVDKQRPPHLWNDPVTLRANHPLRYSSNSLLEGGNPTLRSLYSFVELFADKLKTTNERRWRSLVERVVEVFSRSGTK
jgi:hypothetical protein